MYSMKRQAGAEGEGSDRDCGRSGNGRNYLSLVCDLFVYLPSHAEVLHLPSHSEIFSLIMHIVSVLGTVLLYDVGS